VTEHAQPQRAIIVVAMPGPITKAKKQTNKNAYRRAKKKAQRSVSIAQLSRAFGLISR
jgi:hypothetical protein